ncbi:MAG: peptidylprolyl isomerase [Gammaproteobacteria bacterium]
MNRLPQRLRQGCLIAFLLAYNACAAAVAEPLDAIIAVVNDDVVMASEINRMFERVKAELQQQRGDPPSDAALRRQVLERLIVMKIQLQLAAQTGLKVDDDTLNRAVSNIAAENGMPLARFREAVERDGYDFAQFREDIRNEIIISRLRQREVSNLVHISDREIDNYLATQVQQDTIEMEYHLAHILVATPQAASEEDTEKARKKAEKLLRRAHAGEDFLRMAAKSSGDPQALDSGDLGWRKAGEVPTVFSEVVTSLREGEISDIIGSPSGYHIIKLLGVRSAGEELTVKQTRARHILIKPSELMSSDDVRERLHKLKKRVETGDDFDDLARSHSEDKATAAKGGDLGWISPGDLLPKFDEVMGSLRLNEISEPFETEFGWHIVQVLQRRDHDNTREALRAKARDAIRKRKIEETGQAWLRRLRDEAYVEYRFRE